MGGSRAGFGFKGRLGAVSLFQAGLIFDLNLLRRRQVFARLVF